MSDRMPPHRCLGTGERDCDTMVDASRKRCGFCAIAYDDIRRRARAALVKRVLAEHGEEWQEEIEKADGRD